MSFDLLISASAVFMLVLGVVIIGFVAAYPKESL